VSIRGGLLRSARNSPSSSGTIIVDSISGTNLFNDTVALEKDLIPPPESFRGFSLMRRGETTPSPGPKVTYSDTVFIRNGFCEGGTTEAICFNLADASYN